MWASWDHALYRSRRGLGPQGLAVTTEQLAASGAASNLYAKGQIRHYCTLVTDVEALRAPAKGMRSVQAALAELASS